MIFVNRIVEPASLVTNKAKWLSDYLLAIDNYNVSPTKNNKRLVNLAENKYRQTDVKSSLKNMFEGKCAYCESHLAHVSYGHIEHFKPKSTYPEDCFTWNNLLLGCEICNGSQFKSTHFPLASDNGPLVNPTVENPFDFFEFEYDPATSLANVLGKNNRGIRTEELLGLNRPDLLKHRSRIVRRIAFVAIKAAQGDSLALTEMKRLVANDEEYSAFSIALSNKFGLVL